MCNRERDLRYVFAQELFQLVKVPNARCNEEGLTAAILFAKERLPQSHRVELRHIGAHRKPVDWRGCDDGKVANTCKRHLQSSRDRCCREGEHVHIRF